MAVSPEEDRREERRIKTPGVFVLPLANPLRDSPRPAPPGVRSTARTCRLHALHGESLFHNRTAIELAGRFAVVRCKRPRVAVGRDDDRAEPAVAVLERGL